MFILQKDKGGCWELLVFGVFGSEITHPEIFRLETVTEPKEVLVPGATLIRDLRRTYVVRTRYDECGNSYSHVEVVDDPTYTIPVV